MRWTTVVLFALILNRHTATQETTSVVREKTKDLFEVKGTSGSEASLESKTFSSSTQNAEHQPITPLMVRSTKRQLRKDSTKSQTTPDRVSKPVDVFYRRNIEDLKQESLEWIHCQDLITPFLSGIKKNMSYATTYGLHDHIVSRLIQLLNVNTTGYDKNEIYSVLFQINNLSLRLFQWQIPAITALLNVIVKSSIHSFRTMKNGVKKLFSNWKLDITNTTNLLKQARIFRPPCIQANVTGSTKTHHFQRITKPTTKVVRVCAPNTRC